jgi:hypothetical protein
MLGEPKKAPGPISPGAFSVICNYFIEAIEVV